MAQPYRIIDLSSYTGLPNGVPTGNELVEISNGGSGSFQIPIAILVGSRAPTVIQFAGTYTIQTNQYGDILVSTPAPVTLNLPSALLRSGAPVSIIATTTSIPAVTITPFAGQTIFGLSSSLSITNSYGAFVLWPNSTGLGDWYQK